MWKEGSDPWPHGTMNSPNIPFFSRLNVDIHNMAQQQTCELGEISISIVFPRLDIFTMTTGPRSRKQHLIIPICQISISIVVQSQNRTSHHTSDLRLHVTSDHTTLRVTSNFCKFSISNCPKSCDNPRRVTLRTYSKMVGEWRHMSACVPPCKLSRGGHFNF